MRSLIQSAWCAALLLCTLSAHSQFWTEDFETDGEGSRYTSTTSFWTNTGDFFIRTDGMAPYTISIAEGGFYTGLSGTFLWAGEDMDAAGSDGNDFKTLEFTGIDITGMSNLEFRGLFGGNNSSNNLFWGWDSTDDYYLEYQIDGGGYTTFMQFESTLATNGQLQHDSDLDGVGDGVILGAAMQEISAFITGISGTSMDIRIYVHADSSLEEFAFDHLRLFDIGSAGCTNIAACNYDAGAAVDDGSCILPGDACDDGNALTVQDEVQGDCSCAGITPNLVITEIVYNPNDGEGYPDNDFEYIEVYNAGADAVELDAFSFTGFTLTIPANSTIAAGEYVVFALNPATYSGNGYQVFDMGGGLSNSGELLELIDGNGNVIDAVTYDDITPWPNAADGDGPGLALTSPSDDNSDAANWYAYCVGGGDLGGSPGLANPGPLSGCTDPTALNYEVCASMDDASCTYLFGVSDVVITEIHYNPCGLQGNDDAFEFLELYNTTGGAIDLENWSISNGVSFTFPMGASIASGEYIVVCVDETSYLGNGYQVFEWNFGDAINNTGETLNLFDDSATLIDQVAYSSSAPWPTAANGGCSTAELIDPTGENNDGSAWQASLTFGGTPGAPNSVTGYECADCGVGATVLTTYAEDFESGIAGWTGDTGSFTTSTTDAITTTSLAASGTGTATDELWTSIGCLDISGACTTWNIDLKQTTGWVADADNSAVLFLASDAASSATANGYAVTLSMAFGSGNISLVRFDNGVGTSLIDGPVALPDDQATSVEVRHLEDGTWVLLIDIDGGADTFLAASLTANDNTHTQFEYLGVQHAHNATYADALRVDNIAINQCGVAETYYSVASGNSSDAIWNTDPMGAGTNVTFNRFKSMEIQAGNVVTFNADHDVNTVTIEGSVDLAAQRVTAYGDFTNNGAFTTAGTVAFKGDAAATIGGSTTTQFNAISIEKNAGVAVSLSADAGLNGMMAMESGTFDTNGQVFTLHASATTRGAIGEIKSGATWVGDITFETYIPVATEEGYFNLGNPIVGNTLNAWNDDMETTGFPGSDWPNWPSAVNPYINIYHYNEAALGDLNDNGWIPASSLLNPLYTNNGYMLYLNNGSYVLDVTGSFMVGPVTDVVTHTTSTGLNDDGWNLITNPFPCAVDWSVVYAASTNIQPQYYVMDSDGALGYRNYDGMAGTGTASGIIAAGQSIWVKAGIAGGSIVWNENAKVDGFETFERDDAGIPSIGLELMSDDSEDLVKVFFYPSADAAADYLDGFKLYDAQPSIALKSTDNFDLQHNYIPADVESITIPVNLRLANPFEGALMVSELFEVPAGLCMVLTDLETGNAVEVVEGATLEFTSEATDAPRFELTINRVVEVSATGAACYGQAGGSATATSPVEVTFTWMDEMENILASETGTESTIDALWMGNYFVTVSGGLCAATTAEVWVNQPQEELFSATGHAASCDVFEGWIEVDVAGADAFNVQLHAGSELIASGSFTETVELDGLEGVAHTLTVTTGCNTFTETFDLYDPNTVELELTATTNAVAYNGTPTSVEVFANTTGAEEVLWWVNDEAMGSGSALTVNITETGIYEVTAMAYGESCADSDHTLIHVEQGVDIEEEVSKDIALINGNGFIQLTPQTALDAQALITVFNTAGQQIAQQTAVLSGPVTLTTTDWAQGVYTVQVTAGDFRWNQAFVKH